jgi:hypothetical protein
MDSELQVLFFYFCLAAVLECASHSTITFHFSIKKLFCEEILPDIKIDSNKGYGII